MFHILRTDVYELIKTGYIYIYIYISRGPAWVPVQFIVYVPAQNENDYGR